MEVLVLRFDAPLMSFGGNLVDQEGVTTNWPGRSLIAGLIGNALGYEHRDAESLGRLQCRLRHAVRCDVDGKELLDFQTVDLSQEFMREGWTTLGAKEGRGGGTAKEGTHIRYRHYWADTVHTVALTLVGDEGPSVADLEVALRQPRRPLFFGRKGCLPAAPLVLRRIEAPSLLVVLESTPLVPRKSASDGRLRAWWPAEEEERPGARLVPITDERDWANQIVVGRRFMREGTITVREVQHVG